MTQNKEIAALFSRMAQMLELLGADRFRVNAHAAASRAIAESTMDLAAMGEDQAALIAIEGIGKKTAAKIQEFASSGRITEHDELLAKVPPGVLDVLALAGLGPKTVKAMWEEKGVESIDDLKRIIADGTILELPRMGKKTVENITDAIEFASKQQGRTPLGVALPIAELLIDRIKEIPGVDRAEYAGSLRRGQETVGDIDLLVVAEDAARVHEVFTSLPEVTKVLAHGETKSSVRFEAGRKQIQVDLRTVPAASFGAALLYFTGSKAHNVKLRERAIKRGLTLNEYGLYPRDDGDTPPQQRGVKATAGKAEQGVYDALGLAFVPPELREDLGEMSEDFNADVLIEVGDIRAELHAHTTASDGVMSIDELAACAKARGYHTIAVTDHSRSSAIAGGLDVDRLLAHIDAVREADERIKGISILAGSEVDILADGSLDYEDEILARLDVVVASPHAALRQEAKVATKRLLKAITHPLVHIIGHPTGRLIGSREGLHPALETLFDAAAEHATAMEINANWKRLDLRDTHVRHALTRGTSIAINCDVHRAEGFDNLRYGVATGRRGGLSAARCVNTWTKTKLNKWLKSKR